MMKVVIINCFDTYESRIDLVYDHFKEKGYDVTAIQSNFKHFAKAHRTESKPGFIFVKTKPYYKNISVARLLSHYNYAKKAFKLAEIIKPDLLYVTVPPNSLAKIAAQYKKDHKDVYLIFDLIDLWPETMTIGRIKRIPPFTLWRNLRDNSLKYADCVITECNLYQTVLGDALKGLKKGTLYFANKDVNVVSKPKLDEEKMHLCYLGSINNIIDIPKIKAIIRAITDIKPTTLHIIGDGEKRQTLIDEVKNAGAAVEYHGIVYTHQAKQNIFDICHFGLNIMKDDVCVGLTMKSIDYFQHGLPILNNIQGDTEALVDKYGVGINVDGDGNIVEKLSKMSSTELFTMRNNSVELFESLFSINAFNKIFDEILNKINANN